MPADGHDRELRDGSVHADLRAIRRTAHGQDSAWHGIAARLRRHRSGDTRDVLHRADVLRGYRVRRFDARNPIAWQS